MNQSSTRTCVSAMVEDLDYMNHNGTLRAQIRRK